VNQGNDLHLQQREPVVDPAKGRWGSRRSTGL